MKISWTSIQQPCEFSDFVDARIQFHRECILFSTRSRGGYEAVWLLVSSELSIASTNCKQGVRVLDS